MPGERFDLDTRPEWLRLDTAAKIYPAISATHNNTTFRLNVELYEEVDPQHLQEALVKVMPRFPSFAVTLKRGLFWYFLEANDEIPRVREDSGYPCKRLADLMSEGFLFRVTYYRSQIIMECYHGLADGAGAIEFLKTLLYEYFRACGIDIDSEGLVIDSRGHIQADEYENSFLKYYEEDPDAPKEKLRHQKAYHIIGTPLPPSDIRIIHGMMPLRSFLDAVKKKGVTVSAYVASMLIYIIYREQGLAFRREKRPIVISIPVDLRAMFPSNTLRNFISYANVGVEITKELRFDEILESVSQQLRDGLQPERIHANINRNVKYEKNPFIRSAPLFIKNLVVSSTYQSYGEGCYTMVLSNLKTTRFPKSMEERIRRIYYALGVSELNPMNCVLVSYRDEMIVTFSRGIEQTGIIRTFFEHFSKDLDIPVELRGNEWSVKA